jgi:hypothetical protein
MHYDRIYEDRFKGVNKETKKAVWNEISRWIYEQMGRPNRVLDPPAGEMEFLQSITADEKWGVDLQKPGTLQLSVHSNDGI